MHDDSIVSRFHTKYEKDRDSGCWFWTASLAGKGYGQIKLTGKRRQIYAHRLSYEIFVGKVPEGQYVLHKCDNPRCVNPNHLFVGSQKDNSQDMKNKNRSTHGEKNSNAVLTESEVRAMKGLLAKGELSQSKISEMFGVGQMEVSRIKRGLRWARVKLDKE